MTKEALLKSILDDIAASGVTGDDITWIGGKLIGEGFSRMIGEKFGIKPEDVSNG